MRKDHPTLLQILALALTIINTFYSSMTKLLNK